MTDGTASAGLFHIGVSGTNKARELMDRTKLRFRQERAKTWQDTDKGGWTGTTPTL